MIEATIDQQLALITRAKVFCDLLDGVRHIVHRDQGFDKMGISDVRVIVQSLDNVLEGGDRVPVDGNAEETVSRRIQPNADPVQADGPPHGVQRFEEKSRLVFVTASVLVIAGIRAIGEELMKEVPVGRMDFNTVKAGDNRISSGLSEVIGSVMNLVYCEGAGRHGILETFVGEGLVPGVYGRRGDGKFASVKVGVGHAATVPELAEDVSVFTVYGLGHLFPAFNLDVAVDPRGIDVTDTLLRYLGAFRDDETRRGALGIIFCHERCGGVLGIVGAASCHRRHEYAIRQFIAPNLYRLQKRIVDHLALLTSFRAEIIFLFR